MITFIQWKQEQESLRRLREMVDRMCADITEGRIADEVELERRVDTVRAFCKGLLPDKFDMFKPMYENRFQRLWNEFGPQVRTEPQPLQPDAAAAAR